MANGFSGSRKEWKRIESPLKPLDRTLSHYAKRHGFSFGKNCRNWPERSLRRAGTLDRLIQIYLVDHEALTFNLWLCAYQDRGSKRYWKRRFLKEGVPIEEIQADLIPLLDAARAEVDGWSSDDLEFGGPIGW
jgi:hypothetical protein